jgi:hypothetical protein
MKNTFYRNQSCLALVGTMAAISLCLGCSDNRPTIVPVSGQVLIDGKPLAVGSIQFIHSNARPAGGAIGPDGRFTLTTYELNDGAVVGNHHVRIAASEPHGTNAVRWSAPKKYANTETSGIQVEVHDPVDDLKIELYWEGGKPFVER